MSLLMKSIGCLLVLLLATLMTGWLRKYALSKQLMDVPNNRSSHTVATPRGGGVAIVVAFLLALPVVSWAGLLDWRQCAGLLGAGALVAIIGFMDDHGHIAARRRLIGHFISSVWLLAGLGGFPVIQVFGLSVDMGWIGAVIAAVYLVWMLNLYNFMDGIDGIASVEAVFVCLAGATLYWITDHGDLVWAPIILALAVAGFLYWNFPPARIFMGDAGSGFLGIMVGGLSLQAAWCSSSLFWSWLILLGVFIVDATWTLLRRLLRGDKVYEAHRSHAYQYASRHFGQHRTVTLLVCAINLVWLFPIAAAVALGTVEGTTGLLLAYIPLIGLAIKFKAGALERS